MRFAGMFDGIGGFGLGLERAGHTMVSHTEISPDAQAVLRRNWPGVPIYGDVRTREWKEGEADGICAGFPCQDISQMGPRTGISGSRSGLFWEVVRAVRVVRPRIVALENVVALLRRGMGVVVGSMASLGYDAEWDCIPKAHLGAPDLRDRLWIVAHPQHSDALRPGPHSAQVHLNGGAQFFDQQERLVGPMGAPLASALARVGSAGGRPWDAEPQLSRVADGLPADVVAVKQFGNSLCPRISEAIGLALYPAGADQ
jgi:DNA (cytosine-5)-methyltransferase 1